MLERHRLIPLIELGRLAMEDVGVVIVCVLCGDEQAVEPQVDPVAAKTP
jgi:hypothetical protein